MKQPLRVLLGVWLAAVMLACNLLSGIPTIPPGFTRTPSVTPTFTASPIPSPTATPIPVVRVESGDKALFDGDIETALAHYRAAYDDSSDPVVRAAALWGQARAQYADARYPETLAALQRFITEYPDSPHLAQAYFLQGQANFQIEHYEEAAAAYQTYLTLHPGVIDAYVLELRGDALFAAENYPDALAAYSSALEAPRLDDGLSLQIKIAQTRVKIGDYASALTIYDSIVANTTNDYTKAQMDYLAGLAYQSLGQNEEAHGRFRHAVENYPLSYYSYLGLVELVDAGVEVSDLDRGLVDYFAGQYDVALAAFDRYIAATPGNDGTAHYYRALTLRELQNYEGAINEFAYFIANYSANPKWGVAWSEKATTQWVNLGLYQEAANTLLDFVAAVPTSPFAADYLMSAARILERDNRLDQAAQTWERVADEYPGSDQAPTALFLAGIAHYRQGDYSAALTSFQRSLVLAVEPEDQGRAYLWVGKSEQKLGDTSAMQAAWRQAQTSDPSGYYSERARDLLLGRAPFAPPTITNLNVNLAAERSDADAWVRLTFNLPADTDLSGPGPLASEPRLVRGTELWDLGLYEDARLEFEDLRDAVSTDAVQSYRLANYLLDLGLYRSAIFAARQVLTLAGLDDHNTSMMAPPYFSHIRYGLYYSDLIVPAAQDNGFDPLFLFSVVRQESLFEGFVRSTAGARGLMQIVPGTGANIANSIGWPPNYNPDQLYRPKVSIKLGTHYLASNRNILSGDLYAALAAYNAGPGSAAIWKQLAGNDPDLLLEIIRFEETRQYIRYIYEIYVIYRRLYSPVS